MVEIKSISKRYGQNQAVSDLPFVVSNDTEAVTSNTTDK